mmetsp:Transcript_2415/g.8615  ORF Transcript_2415/g.8615 Transcript_2415/m.8615 type:complete len:215 (+) Transcript_2415:1889-2533(+)
MPGHTAGVGEPRRLQMWCIWSISEEPGRRGACSRSSPMMQPTDQMSTAGPYDVCPKSSAGSRYQRVTTTGESGATFKGEPMALARPMSATSRLPVLEYSKLETFRSRCTTHLRCMYSTADSSWSMSCLISEGEKGLRMWSMSWFMSCSTYSNTRNTAFESPSVTTSRRRTMFGWRSCCSAHSSRMDVTGVPSFSLSIRTRFSATSAPLSLFRAL